MATQLFKLYLGLSNSAGPIPDQDFISFLKDHVSPVIPGYTIIRTLGVWDGIFEDSAILEVSGSDNERSLLESIGARYCAKFDQQCTLLTTSGISDTTFISRERVAA